MIDQPPPQQPSEDISPESLARALTSVAVRSQQMINDFIEKNAKDAPRPRTVGHGDPLNVGQAFLDLTTHLMANPTKIAEAQRVWWRDSLALWQQASQQMTGQSPPPAAQQARDKRFKDPAWEENALFSFIKESYLLTARQLRTLVSDVDGLDEATARKVDFYTRQFIDALSPTNFALTNPVVLRETIATNGDNLLKGLENLLRDLDAGDGRLAVRMADPDAFQIGENVATTPGKVVFENDLMQLIHYTPSTKTVAKRPLLMVPPWINKFYVLDLRAENSFIKWAVDQGNTVFVISWVNPDATLRDKSFEDYMLGGPLAALDAIEQATGEPSVNMLGYCIGGTLLTGTLAFMAATGDERCASATFLTTLIDFEKSGELCVFVDEEQVQALEETMNQRGYLDGADMATTFNMLRSNDLIWSFVINNYLMGKEPLPFDLLYWNSDSTRMPAAMHTFYLRNMYLNNVFKDPGGVTLAGHPIDVRAIKVPCYFLATRDDHIAPWQGVYDGSTLLGGPRRFVLAASGHIAGVINPPDAGKYSHWTAPKPHPVADNAEAWLAVATQQDGSWWPDWNQWLKTHKGGKAVAARVPGDGGLSVLEDAPGRYVRVRSD